MKTKKYIIEEYDEFWMSGWHNIDGTVRLSKSDADELLKEFIDGKGYSMWGSNKFRIKEII